MTTTVVAVIHFCMVGVLRQSDLIGTTSKIIHEIPVCVPISCQITSQLTFGCICPHSHTGRGIKIVAPYLVKGELSR